MSLGQEDPIRVVTLATENYQHWLQRLLTSLQRLEQEVSIEVFTDHRGWLDRLIDGGSFGDSVAVRELAEIGRLGAKRAKFAMYRQAHKAGPFVYLDADVIVLEPLGPFSDVAVLGACADDLSAAPYIADRRFPWPADPTLEARRYVNSGVLVFGPDAGPFVTAAERRVAHDGWWNAHIAAPYLYDNHALCALLNEVDVSLSALAPSEYNWPGFVDADGLLQVVREGDSLVNIDTQQALRLVHFAGVGDLDARLEELPLDIRSLLQQRSLAGPRQQLACAFAELDAALSEPLGAMVSESRVAAGELRRELAAIASGGPYPYLLSSPERMASVSRSVAPQGSRWNGLLCGGAYLEGEEYGALQQIVRSLGISSVLELGAGETTRLFVSLGLAQLAIDAHDGPWIERARAAGAEVAVIAFDEASVRFDPAELEKVLRSVLPRGRVDLLLIDSPIGGHRRQGASRQVLELIEPTWVLFHDARRDADVIFELLADGPWTVRSHFQSHRGMVLLERTSTPGAAPSNDMALQSPLIVEISQVAGSMTLGEVPSPITCRASFALDISLHNEAPHAWSSECGILVSYHWLTLEGEPVLFDGIRSRLPFALSSASAQFSISVIAPSEPGAYRLQVSPVWEGVAWLHDIDERLGPSIAVEVLSE